MSEKIHNTVLGIYDAVADPALWPDVLQNFADQINALGCIVFEWDSAQTDRQLSVTAMSRNHEIDVVNKYIEKCGVEESRDQDVFEAHSLRHDGIDLIQDDVLAPSKEALVQLPNVQKLLMLGILHRAAGLLNKDNTTLSRFSIQLGHDRGRLTLEEQAHMATILPHIAKALDLGRPTIQLEAEHQVLLGAMDRLTIGVCILDARGGVVLENNEFQRQRDMHRVFAKAANGQLLMSNPSDQKRLELLKEHALNHGQFGARPRKEAIATDSDGFLCIELAPLTRAREIGSKIFGGFILYSTDTSLPFHCNTQPIQAAFGLTDAELALVDGIGQGWTNSQIAERRNRSVATINSQVKSILSKTQCATRTQFVRLMMSFGTQFVRDQN